MSGETQAVLRERGVGMLLDGKTYAHVAGSLGVAMSTVAKWSTRYRVSGLDGLREGRRGRRPGEQMALS
ncbi:MAG: helix-turn-helix domain-containing protein [Solirubrobacteraceae bacterium]